MERNKAFAACICVLFMHIRIHIHIHAYENVFVCMRSCVCVGMYLSVARHPTSEIGSMFMSLSPLISNPWYRFRTNLRQHDINNRVIGRGQQSLDRWSLNKLKLSNHSSIVPTEQ